MRIVCLPDGLPIDYTIQLANALSKREELCSSLLFTMQYFCPSRCFKPWGLTFNELMSIGKPVIGTEAIGSAYDLIKDGVNGFMVPEKDSDALYSAMKKIASDPELEKEMGKESKRIIDKGFTYEHMVDGFREAIEYAFKNVETKK